MTQKIVRVGNSAAVTIPKSFLDEINLQIGDEIDVQNDKDLKIMVIKPKNSSTQTQITPEFKNWLDNFMASNSATLKELAQL